MRILTVLAIASVSIALFAVPAIADSYGAFAYSPSSGAYGATWDQVSRDVAERVAMENCSAQSEGCEIAVWFANGCGALATGNDGWGSGWGNSRQRAEKEALIVCGKHAADCSILHWGCSSR